MFPHIRRINVTQSSKNKTENETQRNKSHEPHKHLIQNTNGSSQHRRLWVSGKTETAKWEIKIEDT